MEAYIYNKSLELEGITHEIASVKWKRQFFTGDSFQLIFPATEKNLRLIKKERIVEFPGKYGGFITALRIYTDSSGRKVDFTNTVIIMTGNIGSDILTRGAKKLGFNSSVEADINSQEINNELKKIFKPEFLGRIDEIIIFNNLSTENMRKICITMLEELSEKCLRQGITIKWTDTLANGICQRAEKMSGGARPLRKIIAENIEDYISMDIIRGRIKSGDVICLDYNTDDGFIIKKLCLEANS